MLYRCIILSENCQLKRTDMILTTGKYGNTNLQKGSLFRESVVKLYNHTPISHNQIFSLPQMFVSPVSHITR